MTTRPKPTKAEVERCIADLAARHAKADDRNLERLPDDAAGVLDYLRRYDGPHLPRGVRQADALAGLTLNNYLWWEDRRRESWLLNWAVSLGHFLSTIGAQVGVSKQGLRSRMERLAALLRFDRPDEGRLREALRNEALGHQAATVEQAWICENRERLHAIVAGLLAEAARHNPERREPVPGEDEDAYRERWEWLDWLANVAEDDDFTPQSITLLSLASGEVRASPGVLALTGSPGPYNVHKVLIAADRLRADFAALGKRHRTAGEET